MARLEPKDPFPTLPTLKHAALRPAGRILSAGHESALSFFNLFHTIREDAKGTTADWEQDLLRAMLVFASAALDNALKRVITDALALVIDRDVGARKKLREFAESRIGRRAASLDGATVAIDHKFLVELLLAPNPRAGVVDALVVELTSNSLQSKDEVMKVCAHFGLEQRKICPDVAKLQEAFSVRNDIVHEMDVNLAGTTRKRTSRRLNDMRDHTQRLLVLGTSFLTEVDGKLGNSILTSSVDAPVLPSVG